MVERYPKFKSAMCYAPIFGFIYSFFIFLQAEEPKSMKFHAVQSLLIGMGFLISMFTLILIVLFAAALGGGSFIRIIVFIAYFIGYNSMLWGGFLLTFILMIKAFHGIFKVPIVGIPAYNYAFEG
jgi:uncharacterized membrane protein